jgi:hypothetical protein
MSRPSRWYALTGPMLLALAHLIVASIFAPARAASPDALALVHEWETLTFPNGILDYFRRSAIENLAAELHIDETLSTRVVDRFVVPAFQANRVGLEESLALLETKSFSDEEIHVLLRCFVIAKRLFDANRDPRSSDCAPPALKEKAAANELIEHREFQRIIQSWYISTRGAALSNHSYELRAMGVDPTKTFPVEIPIPKAMTPPH